MIYRRSLELVFGVKFARGKSSSKIKMRIKGVSELLRGET